MDYIYIYIYTVLFKTLFKLLYIEAITCSLVLFNCSSSSISTVFINPVFLLQCRF